MRAPNRSWPAALAVTIAVSCALPCSSEEGDSQPSARRKSPNILLAITDDQSYFQTGRAGSESVRTPAFDRIARQGVWFPKGFCASPGCSPSRAALLTGKYPWQLGPAGTHGSSFPKEHVVFVDRLEAAGYATGYTGKGWGPGNWKVSGRERNPCGPAFNALRNRKKSELAVSSTDYAANFGAFLETRGDGQPFFFWYGAHEPHRQYRKGSGVAAGKKLADATVPDYLPDLPEVRSDLLDADLEIEHADGHLARMIERLEQIGELENTLIVATSDNGTPFPRAKANAYEDGFHVPLAISWRVRVPGGRVCDELVSLIDLAPTFLEAAGVAVPSDATGRSLLALLESGGADLIEPRREAVFAARERHSSSRHGNLGYPQRAMRTKDWLLIWNPRPERWPAGHPAGFRGAPFGFYDIDGCPTKTLLCERRENAQIARYFQLATAKRPEYELFHVQEDPGCVRDLARIAEHGKHLERLRRAMHEYLKKTGDPRVGDEGDVFESYPRLRGTIRKFPATVSESAERE